MGLSASAPFVLVLFLCGCGGDAPGTDAPPSGATSEKGTEDVPMTGVLVSHLPVMKDLAATLEGITDEASADAAVPKIEAFKERFRDADNALGESMDSAVLKLSIDQKMVLGKTSQRILKEKLRVSKIKGAHSIANLVDKAMGV